MIDIVANESGWFTLRGITLSGEQIFYVLSIVTTYYIAKRKQQVKNNFKNKVKRIKAFLEEEKDSSFRSE